MDTVCQRLAAIFSAREVWWTNEQQAALDGHQRESDWQVVRTGAVPSRTAIVATTDRPHLFIHVGELTGGRRLLSDDEALFDAVAVMAARRIDAIRLTLERYETQLREEEMLKLAAEAELKALRAQINPHFLFNALTTIGYLIDSAPSRALDTLLRLTRLLRGVLRPEGEFTTLGREIDLVEHYLDIERERFEERLRVRVEVPDSLRSVAIPSLIVQPLVENAIKHGVAPSASGGDVDIIADRADPDDASTRLRIVVRNTGAPLSEPRLRDGDHVGLENVGRRLQGHYAEKASFTLSADERGYTVATIMLPLTDASVHPEELHAQAVASRPRGR